MVAINLSKLDFKFFKLVSLIYFPYTINLSKLDFKFTMGILHCGKKSNYKSIQTGF